MASTGKRQRWERPQIREFRFVPDVQAGLRRRRPGGSDYTDDIATAVVLAALMGLSINPSPFVYAES